MVTTTLQERPAATVSATTPTHEAYLHAVRALAVARLDDPTARARLLGAKLVYGVGHGTGWRGVTFYEAWQNGARHDFLEVCAAGEQSAIQLAGTTIHEVGHSLAGHTAGHGAAWKAACARLGLRRTEAGGQAYAPEDFDPALWRAIAALPAPDDGAPAFATARGGAGFVGVPTRGTRGRCPLGTGTRGGVSRGPGSGSRLRLYHCACSPPVKVRVASDDFQATCRRCGADFARVTGS